MPTPFEVHLVTPEREVFAGEATIVVGRSVDGELGVMAGHIPLVAELAISSFAIETTGEGARGRLEGVVDGGFLHVVSGPDGTRVDILGESVELSDEIDSEAARRLQAEAEQRQGSDDEGERETAKADLARAAARLRFAGR